jgi:hypothetical protein
MSNNSTGAAEVDAFILAEIDTVPHLEALLLFWTTRPRLWSVQEIAATLYIEPAAAEALLEALRRRSFIAPSAGAVECFGYSSLSGEHDRLMAALEIAYKRDLIRISRMIHSKAPTSVKEFARAFRFKNN